MSTITKQQIQLIHIAKQRLGLDDDLYRDMLFNLFRVRSSKNLTYRQASELLDHFKSRGFVFQSKKRAPAGNIIHLTSPKERNLISVLSHRYIWRCKNGFNLWLRAQQEKGYIKSVALNESSDAHWVIEKLKQMTGTTTAHIANREAPREVG